MRYLEKADEDFLTSATSPDAEVRAAKIKELREARCVLLWLTIAQLMVLGLSFSFVIWNGEKLDVINWLQGFVALCFAYMILVRSGEIRLRLFIDKQIRDTHRPAPQASPFPHPLNP